MRREANLPTTLASDINPKSKIQNLKLYGSSNKQINNL